jgi:hypothetical protein
MTACGFFRYFGLGLRWESPDIYFLLVRLNRKARCTTKRIAHGAQLDERFHETDHVGWVERAGRIFRPVRDTHRFAAESMGIASLHPSYVHRITMIRFLESIV